MDYFSVIQNYYAGSYVETLQEIEKIFDSQDNTLVFYKAKAEMALKKYVADSNTTGLSKALCAYSAFLKDRKITQLKSIVIVGSSNGFELFLLASAQTILGELSDALELCVKGLDGVETEEDKSSNGYIELSLLAVQIALLNDDFTTATNVFTSIDQRLNLTNEGEIIVNLAEAYLKFAQNQDTSGLNFYYFEELAQTYPNWKTQLGLLNLHLQQSNIAEAQGIVDALESDYYQVEQTDSADTFKPHFLAAKITLAIMQGSEKVEQLREELTELDPEHPFVKNHKEINSKFDELVSKFKA